MRQRNEGERNMAAGQFRPRVPRPGRARRQVDLDVEEAAIDRRLRRRQHRRERGLGRACRPAKLQRDARPWNRREE